MAYDKIKITVHLYDSSTENTTQVDEPIFLDYAESDIDIEFELVHDSQGNPILRPKQPPRY